MIPQLVLAQFDDLLVKILLGAAMLSFALAYFEDEEVRLNLPRTLPEPYLKNLP